MSHSGSKEASTPQLKEIPANRSLFQKDIKEQSGKSRGIPSSRFSGSRDNVYQPEIYIASSGGASGAGEDDEDDGIHSYSIDDWIESNGKLGRFQAIVLAQASLAWFAVSCLWLSLTFTSELLRDDLGINKYKSGFAGSTFFGGAAVGTYCISSLADCIGRRKSLIWTTWAAVASAVGMTLVKSYPELLVLRFLNGLTSAGMGTISYCLVVEYMPNKWRARGGIVMNIAWSIAATMVALMAFILRNQRWKWYQVCISSPTMLLAVCLWWIPESARWLHLHGRFNESEKWLQKMSRMNGVHMNEGIALIRDGKAKKSRYDDHDIDSTDDGARSKPRGSSDNSDSQELLVSGRAAGKIKNRSSIYALCCSSKSLTLYTVILCYSWFVNSLLYYGLTLNASNLSGSAYANAALAGALELPALFLAGYLVDKLGRRISVCGFVGVAGIALILSILIPDEHVVTPLALLGKFAITGSFILLYVFTTEIVPTVTRATALGLCTFTSRIASVAAPPLVDIFPGSKAVLAVMGILAVIASGLVLLLKETGTEKLAEASKPPDDRN